MSFKCCLRLLWWSIHVTMQGSSISYSYLSITCDCSPENFSFSNKMIVILCDRSRVECVCDKFHMFP